MRNGDRMASNPEVEQISGSACLARLADVAGRGLASHAHCLALADAAGPSAVRDLSDAVHMLCAIHGNYPGLADLALASCAGPARQWLQQSADAFERERLYLVRLTAAVGPLPSTPGALQTEAALLSLRHALETLARSERNGCALGAVLALVSDWSAIRTVLDRAASRCGIDCPPVTLPDQASVAAALAGIDSSPSFERALGFGAEQMLLQHGALFDLLEARASARDHD